MKRINLMTLAVILSLLMIAGTLAGCGKPTGGEEDTTAANVTTAPDQSQPAETKLQPNLPDTFWDREFRILGNSESNHTSWPNFELYAEDLNGEAMNDSVFSRNEQVKAKYGITVKQTLVNDPSQYIPIEYSSGEDNYDLVFAYIRDIGGLAQKGYFLDLYYTVLTDPLLQIFILYVQYRIIQLLWHTNVHQRAQDSSFALVILRRL